jgi:hypothetical protein
MKRLRKRARRPLARGYTEQLTVRVGVPLHYAIPRVLEDCYTAYPDYHSDLDPGLYVIPIQSVIRRPRRSSRASTPRMPTATTAIPPPRWPV